MKIIFYLCISSLIPFIYGNGDSPHLETLNAIKHMAANNWTINNILLPLPNGYLGKGKFAFTYKGIFGPKNIEVAMKFTVLNEAAMYRKEYEMYTYLRAINNETVEAYGIPAIYYFAPCFNCTYCVMAMTLLESKFQEHVGSKYTDMDILLIFREFVRIGKYIHSCGVRHNDIKFENFMFRRNQAFIIDFNLASKIFEKNAGGTIYFMSRRSHVTEERCPIDDFESFLYFICMLGGVKLDWVNNPDLVGLPKKDLYRRIYNMKLNTDRTLEQIGKLTSKVLENVYRVFAELVFQCKDGFPPYDQMYGMIHDAIKSQVRLGFFPMVSWLSPAEKLNAHSYQIQNPRPRIEKITDPRSIRSPEYPEVIWNFLFDLYHKK